LLAGIGACSSNGKMKNFVVTPPTHPAKSRSPRGKRAATSTQAVRGAAPAPFAALRRQLCW
jgi:hypothetical protein